MPKGSPEGEPFTDSRKSDEKSVFIKINIVQDILELQNFILRQGETFRHGRVVRIPGPEVKLFTPVVPAGIGKLFLPTIGGFREVPQFFLNRVRNFSCHF